MSASAGKVDGIYMEEMKIREIVDAVGGKLLRGDPGALVTHISIDSRDVPEGTLFVPIVGERTDAHRFLADVEKAGAAAAFTAEGDVSLKAASGAADAAGPALEGAAPETGFALIAVDDTLKALQALGAACRRRRGIPLVGVTGSVGKTTTREMIAAALSAGFRVYRTPGNHNSQIGVPLTLSEISAADEIGVIEMGVSIPGEMTRISSLVKPDAAVFTNIGVSHIEMLGSQEGILKEKAHIQDGMPEGSTVFVNGEDPLLRNCPVREGFRRVRYGLTDDCEAYAENVTLDHGCPRFTAVVNGKRIPVKLSVYGKHQVLNAMAALAVADAFGVDLHGAAEKLSEFRGYRHRQQIFYRDGVTVIDDSYNASPDSMRAALEILGEMTDADVRTAVLADMKELGDGAPEMHRGIGRFLAEGRKADVLFTLGPLAEQIAAGVRETEGADVRIFSFTDRDALQEALERFTRPGHAVLFKGSNSMKLSVLADRMSGNAE